MAKARPPGPPRSTPPSPTPPPSRGAQPGRPAPRTSTPAPRPGLTIPPRQAGATMPPSTPGTLTRPGMTIPPRNPGGTAPPSTPGRAGLTIPPRPAGATRPPGNPATLTRPGLTIPPRNPGATQPPSTPGGRSGLTIPPRSPGATQPPSTPGGRPGLIIPPRAAGATVPAGMRSQNGRMATPPPTRKQTPTRPPGRGRRRGRAFSVFLILLLVIAGGLGGGYWWLAQQYGSPGPGPAPVRVQVAQGENLKLVLGDLARQGAIGDPRLTLAYLRLHGQNPRIKVGTYEIPAHASPADIVRLLKEGKVILEQITIVEGSTFADFRRQLDASPVITHALRGKTDAEVMVALGHPQEDPEGRFFPDTYSFDVNTADLVVLKMAYNRMQHLLESAWPDHDPGLPYTTPYQALTLASLVEKETGVPVERPRIAGVFVNRLRKGMRLQTDPSVIYGMRDHYDGSIHKKDLETDTPYNTYTRGGLPPTPIALPGKDAVLAAMHPEATDALYFVATGNGGHHFSRTLEEHNLAVKQWLSRRVQGGAAGAQ